jgi:Taurine catabolism dioxygenase TauD, TfdA family
VRERRHRPCHRGCRAARLCRDARHPLPPFSRNGEEAEDEAPWYATPICTVDDGRVFCKWNRNRIENAQKLEGVPPLTASQRQAMEYFDAVLRRPENMFCMHLAPGDLQILCNQAMLAIAYGDSRRLDRGPEGRVERPSPNDKRLLWREGLSAPRFGRDDGDRHTR